MDFKKNPPTEFKPIGQLTKEQATREIAALREGIRHRGYLYYVKNRPTISDGTCDELFQRLVELEATFSDLRSTDSPTARVEAQPVTKLRKAKHAAPMLSLEAVHEEDEVRAFNESMRKAAATRVIDYVLEPKFDGFSIEIVYRGGRFERGVTRGDGDVGEDISHNLKTVRAVPLALHSPREAPARLAVRGEVFMPERTKQPLAGKAFVLTGRLGHYEARRRRVKVLPEREYRSLIGDA